MMNLIKVLFPLLLLSIGCINKIHEEQKSSIKDDNNFIAMHIKITKLIAIQQSKYFDYRKTTKGIMLPRGDIKTIYLSKEDYININN